MPVGREEWPIVRRRLIRTTTTLLRVATHKATIIGGTGKVGILTTKDWISSPNGYTINVHS